MRKVYLCGPITGLKFDEASDWRDSSSDFVERLRVLGWDVLSPMRGKDVFRKPNDEPLDAFFDDGAPAVQQDLDDIEDSEAVIVNLLGAERVSLGSMCELGYAYAKGKPIILVYEGDSNVHHHVFPEYMATVVVESLEGALAEIVQIPGEAVPYVPPLPLRPATIEFGGVAFDG